MNPFLIKPLWIQSLLENLMALAIILNTHACANSIKYPFITKEQSKGPFIYEAQKFLGYELKNFLAKDEKFFGY